MFKICFSVILTVICVFSSSYASTTVKIDELKFDKIETSLAALKLLKNPPEHVIESVSGLLGNDLIVMENEVEKSRQSWYQTKPVLEHVLSTTNPLPKQVYVPIRGLPWKYEDGRYYIREFKFILKKGLAVDKYNEQGMVAPEYRLAINPNKDSLIKTANLCTEKACKEHMYISETDLPEGHNFDQILELIQSHKSKIREVPFILMATVDLNNLIKTQRVPSIFGYYLDGTISNLSLLVSD